MKAIYRAADREDLTDLISLLRDDTLGTNRESTHDDQRYAKAFEAIAADKNQFLLVAELDDDVVGMLQLTLTPGLSRGGAWRGTIESMRVRKDLRGKGIGGDFVGFAVGIAKAHGCSLVQLTSDVRREDAHRFYERLGFVRSHFGFKRELR